jgi:hypothetical protein
VRAQTDEAAALVEFLQELTSGLTVREIVDLVPVYGRTMWAGFLNGSQLIPGYLLEKLVYAVVPEPRLRQWRLERGQELLDEAERAAAGRLPPHEMSLPERELRRRLEQAQNGRIDAQQQLLKMTNLVTGLAILVTRLQQRCADLEGMQRRSHRDLSQQRQQFQQRLQIAEHNLAEAQQRQQETESLRVEALQRAERYRQALAQEQDASAVPPGGGEAETPPFSEPTPEELQDYDTLLEQSTERLDETDRAVDQLRRQFGITPPPERETPSSQRHRLVRGQVEDKPDPAETTTPPDGVTEPALPVHSDPPEAEQERPRPGQHRLVRGQVKDKPSAEEQNPRQKSWLERIVSGC